PPAADAAPAVLTSVPRAAAATRHTGSRASPQHRGHRAERGQTPHDLSLLVAHGTSLLTVSSALSGGGPDYMSHSAMKDGISAIWRPVLLLFRKRAARPPSGPPELPPGRAIPRQT